MALLLQPDMPGSIMAVAYFFLLSSLGLVITAQAQGCSRPVPGPNMVLKDKDIELTEFPEQSTVRFTCEVGYAAAGGSSASSCFAGIWSTVALKCERKNCGSLGDVLNGDINYPDDTLFGDKATVTCNNGYKLVGRREIRCGDQGWMDRLPTCHVITCNPPPTIADGSVTPDKEFFEYRDVVTYTCRDDYTLNGSKSRQCSDDGTFTPGPPNCIYVQCDEPNIENAVWVRGSRPPFRYKATVTHKCISEMYKMLGESTSVCEKDNKWSPELATCKPKNCTKPDTVPNMSFNEMGDLFQHGTSVTFNCNDGYRPAGGSAVITCTAGSWSTLTLKCKRTTVPKPTPSTSSPGEKDGSEEEKPGLGSSATNIILGVGVSIVAVAVAVGAGWFFCKKKEKDGKHSNAVDPNLLDVKTSA
uniref:membrane cofactor protein-like isoform X2 n=1 Tax=Semicossyphus pulcher TaxID=241346 RepID=UPI0037E811C0